MWQISNGQVHFTRYELEEFIHEKGFSVDDVRELLGNEELEYYKDRVEQLEDCYEEYQWLADGFNSNMQHAALELDSVSKKLASGRGMTKAEAASTINKIIEQYLVD